MTTDLWMLAASVALAWALIMIDATPGILANGIGWALGNRAESPPKVGFGARAERAASNMMENLPLFAALVLIAHVAGTADAQTALGAKIFLFARIAHGGLYLAGIGFGLRTGTWLLSCVGMGMIGASFFG